MKRNQPSYFESTALYIPIRTIAHFAWSCISAIPKCGCRRISALKRVLIRIWIALIWVLVCGGLFLCIAFFSRALGC